MGELKQQTFAIHGGQPELKLHKSCALRMSDGGRGLSRRAPINFSRPCRFATTLHTPWLLATTKIEKSLRK